MNIDIQKNFVFGFQKTAGFLNPGMKSTQQKQQRQSERDGQVAFFEKQKQNLKNMNCDSLEEISRKLDMLHSYEDQIAQAKERYNREQMSHILDEAKEWGEKMAEALEKNEPKTAEERREDMAEEALGADETESEMDELLEEMVSEELEEMTEELTEEQLKELKEAKEAAIQQERQQEQEALQAAAAMEEEDKVLYPCQRIDLYV